MRGDQFTNVPANGDIDPEGGDEPNRLASIANTARVLGGITEREVYNMLDRNELEAIKLGRRRMILVESIDRLIAERRDSRRVAA